MTGRAELKQLMVVRPEVRRVFDALKSSPWNANPVVEVPVLASAVGLRESLVRKVFETLEEYGHGRLILGRHGSPTRFARDELQLRKPFHRVLPSYSSSDPTARLGVTKVRSVRGASVTEWTVKLLKRRHARVLLPAELASGDIDMLRKFLDEYEAQLQR